MKFLIKITFCLKILTQILQSLNLKIRMQKSNSKERQTYSQTQQQRNSKTSQSTRVAITPQNLNLNTPLTVKAENNQKTVLPPKPPQKVQYKVDINMTQSKIFQAKQGLQLLKKKMNRNEVSREKKYSQTLKITSSENQKSIQMPIQQNKVINKQIDQNAKLDTRVKNIINQREQNITQYIGQNSHFITKVQIKEEINDDRPISNQVDFMQLLEKQMQNQKSFQPSHQQGPQPKILNQNGVQVILEKCQMGCGRYFIPDVLQKHQKICRKVFQCKRKAFNSAAFRQPEVEGIKTIPPKLTRPPQQKEKSRKQIPKWKLQSAQLRAGLKSIKNAPLSKEQEKILATQQNNFTQCPCCSRKFNQNAASKHIPFCQKKSKEMKNKVLGARK